MSDVRIDLTNGRDWSYRGQKSKIAPKFVENGRTKYLPISTFDLGFTLNARFIAVEIVVRESKPTWSHGGFLHQAYPLRVTTESRFRNQASTDAKVLLLNRTRLLEFPRLSGTSYRLIYSPRRWFKNVKIKVWQYRGEEFNFAEDTLKSIEDKINQLL